MARHQILSTFPEPLLVEPLLAFFIGLLRVGHLDLVAGSCRMIWISCFRDFLVLGIVPVTTKLHAASFIHTRNRSSWSLAKLDLVTIDHRSVIVNINSIVPSYKDNEDRMPAKGSPSTRDHVIYRTNNKQTNNQTNRIISQTSSTINNLKLDQRQNMILNLIQTISKPITQ